ncbi:MAG: restriction endonuclease [Muribaculaceae bacterium]|nr:restriction endonuclease [Muribaculaceae bacterium]
MAIPTFDDLMLPFLEVLSDDKPHSKQDVVDTLAKKFNLSKEELEETIPSGGKKFSGRVGWARTYLKASGLIISPARAIFLITERGRQALESKPEHMLKYLKQYNEYTDFEKRSKKDNSAKNEKTVEKAETPDEMLASAQEQYFNNLQSELLSKLKQVDPVRFEQIVIILMEKMNYGVGSMTKLSHDGGIDGIIDEDELGLEKIYLQAKRYAENKVNEKEMQNFAGALGCSTVRKGVFITTSFFDERAKKKADSIQGKVIRLIDGQELTRLMIKHNIGVQLKTKIEIKKLDEDFFNEEE